MVAAELIETPSAKLVEGWGDLSYWDWSLSYKRMGGQDDRGTGRLSSSKLRAIRAEKALVAISVVDQQLSLSDPHPGSLNP